MDGIRHSSEILGIALCVWLEYRGSQVCYVGVDGGFQGAGGSRTGVQSARHEDMEAASRFSDMKMTFDVNVCRNSNAPKGRPNCVKQRGHEASQGRLGRTTWNVRLYQSQSNAISAREQLLYTATLANERDTVRSGLFA